LALQEGADLGTTPEGIEVSRSLLRYVRFLLSKGVRVRSVIVIGSRARGEWLPWSDTDVVIVVDQADKRLPRNEDALAIGLEARVFRPNELLKALEEFRLTALEAGDHGIPIYDDGFWHGFKARFEELREVYGLERTELGWLIRNPHGHHGSS